LHAPPFKWKFTQEDLQRILAEIPCEFSHEEKAAA